jgi:hypothetical protein
MIRTPIATNLVSLLAPALLAPALLAPALLAPALLAQQNPKPDPIHGSLFPQNYTQEFFFDVDALMDTDLWEAVERSIVIPPLFQKFRREFGFRITDMKSIQVGAVREEIRNYSTMRAVAVFRGTRPFQLPSLGKNRPAWRARKKARIAGFPVVQEGGTAESGKPLTGFGTAKLFVIPRPNVMVFGERSILEPILRKKARGGVPHPDLTAFTAGRRPLAYGAGKVPPWSKPDHAGPFKRSWLTKADPMTFLMVRLHIDPKNEHTILSMTVRFTDGKTGPSKMKKGMLAAIAESAKDKRFAVVKDVLTQIVFGVEGGDLVATLDLGAPKSASKVLVSVVGALPLLFVASAEVQAVEVQEVEVSETEEVEEDVVDEKKRAKKIEAGKNGEATKAKKAARQD